MFSNFKSKAKILPEANAMIVVGYALAAAGLVGVLTINGASDVPALVQAGVAALIIIGLLLPITGILKLRGEIDKAQVQVRNGLFMYGLALAILLLGVAFTVVLSSLSGSLAGIAFLAISCILALAGILTLRKKYSSFSTSEHKKIDYLLLGTILILAGVGLIIVSDIASYYTISQLENIVYVDIGATISAYGCVISAYSLLKFHPGIL